VEITKKKEFLTLEKRLFDIAFVSLLISFLLSMSAWCALDETGIMSLGLRAMKYMAAAVCCILIVMNLVRKRYDLKAIIALGLLGLIFGISTIITRNAYIMSYWFFLAGGYGQSSKRIMTLATITTWSILFIVIVSSQIGCAVDYVFDGGMFGAHGLGFDWCTDAPIVYFFSMLVYIFLRKEKMRIWEFAILEAVNIFFYIMTDTKMTFWLGTVAIIFFFIESLIKHRWVLIKKLNILWVLLPIIICIACIVIALIYNPKIAFWDKINSIMSNRLELSQSGLETYGITPFGQSIWWIGYNIGQLSPSGYNYVDCSYIQVMLEFGIFTIVAILAIYMQGIKRAEKYQDYWMVCILIIALLHSTTEPRLMNFAFNILPILAFLKLGESPLTYERGWLKKLL